MLEKLSCYLVSFDWSNNGGYSVSDQASDLWQPLELASELESKRHCGTIYMKMDGLVLE